MSRKYRICHSCKEIWNVSVQDNSGKRYICPVCQYGDKWIKRICMRCYYGKEIT